MWGEGATGGVCAGDLFIAPAGEDEAPCEASAATGAPDADPAYGCQEVGVASCGVEYTGTAAPELLRAAVTGGVPPLEEDDAEGEDVAKDGVEEDGVKSPHI